MAARGRSQPRQRQHQEQRWGAAAPSSDWASAAWAASNCALSAAACRARTGAAAATTAPLARAALFGHASIPAAAAATSTPTPPTAHPHPHPPHCIAQAPAPRPLCPAFESPTVAVHVYKVAAPVPSSISCTNDEWSDSWWMVGGGWVDGEAAWLRGSQPRKKFCHSLSVKVFAHKPTFSPNQFQANLSGARASTPIAQTLSHDQRTGTDSKRI